MNKVFNFVIFQIVLFEGEQEAKLHCWLEFVEEYEELTVCTSCVQEPILS